MTVVRTLLILLSFSLFLTGCVVSRGRVGNPIDEHNLEKVVKGVTHRDQIVELLGAPDRIILGDEKEILQYYYYDAKSPALILLVFNILTLNVKSDNLYVFLNQQGIAQDIIYGKRTHEVDFTLRPWGK
jgi:outer membrane protein assembly factor BamE (lipoprotein component of BamABCDE complex)